MNKFSLIFAVFVFGVLISGSVHAGYEPNNFANTPFGRMKSWFLKGLFKYYKSLKETKIMIKTLASLLTAIVFVALLSITAHAQTCPFLPGCLDPTFGTGGKVTYQFSTTTGVPLDMVVQTDGKIVELFSGNKLIRLNSDGTLDPTFGSGGVVTITWTFTSGSTTYNGSGKAMRLQEIGGQQRIVVAGAGHLISGRKVVAGLRLGRFMPDGTADTSFGSGGSAVINAAAATEMEIQSDGKILTLCDNGALVRTNVNGSLDTGFGSGGLVNAGYLQDIVIDGNGGIIVGGNLTTGKGNNTKTMLAVKRYTSAGVGDTAFGNGGIATADFNTATTSLGKLAVDPFGNIVAAGQVYAPGFAQYYFAAARFTSNGLADTSFGGTGKVMFVGASGSGRGVLIQSDGKVVLTGNLNSNYGLVRYNYDGTLDSTFGNGGMVSEDVNGTDLVNAWAMQTDPACACSKVVMSSSTAGASGVVSFARFTVQ